MAATTPAKKRAPQKRKPPAKVNGNGNGAAPDLTAELPDINTEGRTLDTTRVVLFRINGHDYTVPESPSQGMVMGIIHEIRVKGGVYGLDFALEEMLGTDDYAEFRRVADYLGKDEIDTIGKAVENHILGIKTRMGKGSSG